MNTKSKPKKNYLNIHQRDNIITINRAWNRSANFKLAQ